MPWYTVTVQEDGHAFAIKLRTEANTAEDALIDVAMIYAEEDER